MRNAKVNKPSLVIQRRIALWTSKHGGGEPAGKAVTAVQVEEKSGWMMKRGEGHLRGSGQQVAWTV